MGKQVFTYDITKFSAAIQKRLREAPELAHAAMRDVGARIEREAKFRCPVDIGTLTASIQHTVVVAQDGIAAVIYIPENDLAAPYAILMHENQYQLGKNSLERQNKVGVPVGRKFITRAIDDNPKAIAGIITAKLKVSQWT